MKPKKKNDNPETTPPQGNAAAVENAEKPQKKKNDEPTMKPVREVSTAENVSTETGPLLSNGVKDMLAMIPKQFRPIAKLIIPIYQKQEQRIKALEGAMTEVANYLKATGQITQQGELKQNPTPPTPPTFGSTPFPQQSGEGGGPKKFDLGATIEKYAPAIIKAVTEGENKFQQQFVQASLNNSLAMQTAQINMFGLMSKLIEKKLSE